MKVLVVVALTSCNSVFGNDGVTASPQIDAQFFDAVLDAPPACPSGLPMFRSDLYDVETTGPCSSYSVAENGTMLAVCKTGDGKTVLESGSVVIGVPMKMPLLPVATDLTGFLLGVRVAPEGDFALARVLDMTVTIHALREVSGMWTDLGVAPMLPGNSLYSTPSRGPTRHLLVSDQTTLVELVGDGTAWTALAPPYVSEGFTTISQDFGLTPDGLRLVALSGSKDLPGSAPRYGARSDLSSAFTTSAQLDEPATITLPLLTEDCDALFFIGLERILYVKQ